MGPAAPRQILHLDMDAFYASVEQRDHPELRGRPVLVGGDPRGRGVISAASYEARPFGCRSAMPTSQALRLCPQAVLLPVRMDHYVAVSRQVFALLEQYTPEIEPLSIDEAFLDVTGSTRLFGPAAAIARMLKDRIRAELTLTASVGVAPNKFVAKLASDLRKPDGLVVVSPDEVADFLAPLPIARLWGAGPATQRVFEKLRVHTFGDARRLSVETLRHEFGDHGEHFWQLVRGLDDRPVETDREARSISHEHTFAQDVADLDHVRAVLLDQTEHVAARLRRHGRLAATVVLKVRRPDFATFTRRLTLPRATDQTAEVWAAAATLFDAWRAQQATPVRLIGMGVTGLTTPAGQQLELFGQTDSERQRRLDQAVDSIRARFGSDAIRRGGTLGADE